MFGHVIILIPWTWNIHSPSKHRVWMRHCWQYLLPDPRARAVINNTSGKHILNRRGGNKMVGDCFQFTCAVSTGFSNTGLIRIVSQFERMKLVMKNPPHTAHISHSRLKEWRLVLYGTRVLPLRTHGKNTLKIFIFIYLFIIFYISSQGVW